MYVYIYIYIYIYTYVYIYSGRAHSRQNARAFADAGGLLGARRTSTLFGLHEPLNSLQTTLTPNPEKFCKDSSVMKQEET